VKGENVLRSDDQVSSPLCRRAFFLDSATLNQTRPKIEFFCETSAAASESKAEQEYEQNHPRSITEEKETHATPNVARRATLFGIKLIRPRTTVESAPASQKIAVAAKSTSGERSRNV
jgi:hypothetical protein